MSGFIYVELNRINWGPSPTIVGQYFHRVSTAMGVLQMYFCLRFALVLGSLELVILFHKFVLWTCVHVSFKAVFVWEPFKWPKGASLWVLLKHYFLSPLSPAQQLGQLNSKTQHSLVTVDRAFP